MSEVHTANDDISVTISEDQITVGWWTPEIADLLCCMCVKCSGWRNDPIPDCEVANSQWCG